MFIVFYWWVIVYFEFFVAFFPQPFFKKLLEWFNHRSMFKPYNGIIKTLKQMIKVLFPFLVIVIINTIIARINNIIFVIFF